MSRKGFTIIELLVVVSIIALLVGILLPAIGRARDAAKTSVSMSNLRQLAIAHATYESEWGDKQFTLSREDLGQYTGICDYESRSGAEHPWVNLGWASDGTFYGFPLNCGFAGNEALAYPYFWQRRYGWFRLPNAKQFNQYMTGKMIDNAWFAPKDRMPIDTIESYEPNCFDDPGEFCPDIENFIESSYCLSPAASFAPAVLGSQRTPHVWRDPQAFAGAMRSPSSGQARYPDLKSRMIEHHWLQNQRPEVCNPGINGVHLPGNCEPWYFHHSRESNPMTMFFDGHVEGLGIQAVESDNNRAANLSGARLWFDSESGQPFALDGYFGERRYDGGGVNSPHVLTRYGIFGRDWFGQ